MHLIENTTKRIMAHNLDKMEKENKPEEAAAIFEGAKMEKVKAIKGGKNVLDSNSDILKPRVLEPWKKVTDMVLDKDGNPVIPDKTSGKNETEIIEADANAYEELLQPINTGGNKITTKILDNKNSRQESESNTDTRTVSTGRTQEGFQVSVNF